MNLKGSLPLLILHILSKHKSHGYEISKLIRERTGGTLDFREGTLYPTLHNMEQNGLVKSYDDKFDGRRRRYYELTELGRSRLGGERVEWDEYMSAVNAVLEYAGKPSEDGKGDA